MNSKGWIELVPYILSALSLIVSVCSLVLYWKQAERLNASELSQWTVEASNELAKATSAFHFQQDCRNVNAVLSGLIERGRFWFPNSRVAYGEHKANTHQGYRPRILDWLVFASKLCNLDVVGEKRESVTECLWSIQTAFTGDSQSALQVVRSQRKVSGNEDFMDASKSDPRIREAETLVRHVNENTPSSAKG